MAATELPELLVPDTGSWRAWLIAEHESSAGVWLVLHKKGGSVTTLTYDQALDEALCFGWIDGQVGRRDEGSYRQRFTPRRARSPWSARNVEHVARLQAAGLIAPAGAAAIEKAKADGRWESAYAGQASAELPADLATAIQADPAAREMFQQLTAGNKYALIYRVNAAKRADTRARRIREFVQMLARGETVHPQRGSAARPRGGAAEST
ncbi:MAG: hypothetical protein JWO63_655 [Frankiales bacterium]|nr:hypothetical protein [Frankiales bacterium]